MSGAFSAISRFAGVISTPCPRSPSISFSSAQGSTHHAVADDRQLARPHDARGQEAQLVGAVADDQGVAGIVAALEAHDHVGPLGEPVDDLALALVAPLGADHRYICHPPTPWPQGRFPRPTPARARLVSTGSAPKRQPAAGAISVHFSAFSTQAIALSGRAKTRISGDSRKSVFSDRCHARESRPCRRRGDATPHPALTPGVSRILIHNVQHRGRASSTAAAVPL